MAKSYEEIVELLPTIRETLMEQKEILLANLVMIGESAAPTFDEDRRGELLQDRFRVSGLDNVSSDDFGNALGVISGAGKGKAILLGAHLDSVLQGVEDLTVSVESENVVGAGLSNNAIGLAVLASMPNFLESLNVELQRDLVLIGHSQSHGHGDLTGLKSFLDNTQRPIGYGVCVDGLQLGRLSHRSISMLRGKIRVDVPKEFDWTSGGIVGAIQVLCDVVNQIAEIPIPRKPLTSVVMGSIHGGKTYNIIPTSATLRFEIRSESAEILQKIFDQIEEIAMEAGANAHINTDLHVVARRHAGGIGFSHPMTRTVRNLLEELEVELHVAPSTSALTAFTAREIPAVTVGLTRGKEAAEERDILEIDSIFTGLTMLIGLLLAIDNGCCDES